MYVYQELLDALRRYAGYREGDWDMPPENGDRDTFYIFPYDFRRDNVETARELVRRIEELKRKLGRPDLRFNIVAHSMGGLVARYAAMYGDADLPAAPVAPQPTWAGASSINKIFMFGTPNEGSAEAFVTILEGYSVTEGLRPRVRLFNKLTPEDAVSIPSAFILRTEARRASSTRICGRSKLISTTRDVAALWLDGDQRPRLPRAFRARARAERGRGENGEAVARRLDATISAVLTAPNFSTKL